MKLFVTPDSLRKDSYALASKVVIDGFQPTHMIAIWRGGATIGICMHEFFKYLNIPTDHIAIRTSRYTGIDETASTVHVHNLGYLLERLNKDSKVLLVDDVYDSGLSIEAVFEALKEKLGDNTPQDIRVATVYYKPKRNKTTRVPDYFVHESDEWIVFPHELEGLSLDEISQVMGPEIADLVKNAINKNIIYN